MDFEKLIKEQGDIYAQICKLKENIRKDSKERKSTLTYFEKRRDSLSQLYNDFKKNDQVMADQFNSTKDHEYWSTTRKITKDSYSELMNNLNEIIENWVQPTEETPLKTVKNRDQHQETVKPVYEPNQQESNMAIEIQLIKGADLMKTIKIIQKDWGSEVVTKSYVRQKLNNLKSKWTSLSAAHPEAVYASSGNTQYVESYNDWEVYYDNITAKLEDELENLEQVKAAPVQLTSKIKLPKIDIPMFNGNYLNWITFRDIFTQIVHSNKDLPNVTKMHYLKSHVTDQAAGLLNSFQVSDENYMTAWNMIQHRYNNKRLLVSTHIKKLLNIPASHSESAAPLRKIVDTSKEILQSIANLGIDVKGWDPLVLELLLPKLDAETHKLFEQKLENPKEIPTMQYFFNFLETRFQSLEMIGNKSKQEGVSFNATKPKYTARNTTYTYNNSIKNFCRYCKGNHLINNCINFKNLAPKWRNEFATKADLCKKCLLHLDHIRCETNLQCNTCKGTHHTLLHQHTPVTGVIQQEEAGFGLLATAVIKIKLDNGGEEYARIFIDSGSQASYINETSAQRLRLRKQKTNMEISGIGEGKITSTNKTTFIIKPRFESDFELEINAYVLSKLTRRLPNNNLNTASWKHIHDLIWADPKFNVPGAIDILLGMDYIADILMPEIIKSETGPTAQRTKLGWIMFGAIKSASNEHQIQTMISTVEDDLQRFWEVEEIQCPTHLTTEHANCEKLYQEGYKRLSNGSYEVKLPLKENVELGHSKKQVIARFLQIEKKLQNNPTLKRDYHKFMEEYLSLGHMVPANDSTRRNNYLPHHAVIKETSTTTKLRVVFDASMKTSSGSSLNDAQLIGPTLQQDLFSIVLRWRRYKYVFTADIEKMYRQIKVTEEHQDLQKIVWRDDPKKPLQEYKLTTVTYGTASAPYLAIKTLHQLAHDEETKYPQAAEILKRDFYVDDVLTGAHSLDEILVLQKELTKLLKCGGFNLRKWCSNSREVLQTVPEENREFLKLELTEHQNVKTLGVYWDPQKDEFSFKVPNILTTQKANTKRNVLSNIARIFDPLGWIAPITITAKILMQRLWEENIGWDEKIPNHLEIQWMKFQQRLQLVSKIKIPRWINSNHNVIELHGFCDASDAAYAAVIYSRVTLRSGDVKVTLLASKTRVAPLKKINTPRLELCGAVLLARLMNNVRQSLESPTSIYAYTDSTITLAWIQGPSNRWKVFVGNRVAEIQNNISPSYWFHVKSEDNPADAASRGLTPEEIQNNELWWSGPKWLRSVNSPASSQQIFSTQEEVKKIKLTTQTTIQYQCDIWDKYSSYTKLIRIIAYMKRFTNNARCKDYLNRTFGALSTDELRMSRNLIISNIQKVAFNEELKMLEKGYNLNKTSSLCQLHPFIDKESILRVGGRLRNSIVSFDTKHPIILPKDHHFTKLIIEDTHAKTLHGGCQLVSTKIRSQYWIVNAKQIIKKIINKCVRCYRYKTKEATQLMGQLPSSRVRPSRPFTHTGIDYAGPIKLKSSVGRSKKMYKAYIAVFICMTTKAVHLEVVSDLTTNTFIAALKRFTSRRGLCSHIYSDCGTTFKGADKQLKADLKEFNKTCIPEIINIIPNEGIKWHFNAPASPHFGGLWEAAVKSAKYHLKRILGEIVLSYEEMSTVLSQIEACLNSRPLCSTCIDIEDPVILTPGHFIIGESLIATPDQGINEAACTLSNRWKLTQKLVQDFWNIWSSEYLTSLQRRLKWHEDRANIEIGNIVLIKEPNLPPTQWALGKIEELHPGTDGKVRVVTVRCKGNNYLKRPIQKICILPIDDNIIDDKLSSTEHQQKTQFQRPNPNLRRSPRFVKGPMSMLTICLICIGMVTALPTPQSNQIESTLTADNTGPKIMKQSSTSPVEIFPFENTPGIYFENIAVTTIATEEWKIVVHFKLENYWVELQQLSNNVRHLTQVCSHQREFAIDAHLCQHTVTYLLDQLRHIDDANNILKTNRKLSGSRKRRALVSFVGTLAHDLFGVLDEEWANKYEAKIQSVEENERYLLTLLKEQTSIAESTLNVYKKEISSIKSQMATFSTGLYNLTMVTNVLSTEVENLKATQLFTTLALSTALDLINCQTIQRELLNIVVDTHQGKINPLILTREQLDQQLNLIHQNSPRSLAIPGSKVDNEIANMFKFMTARSRVTTSKLLIELRIPLVNEQRYQVYKVFPLPTRNGDEYIYIKPSTEFLAINDHKDKFYPMTEAEFNKCHNIEEHEYWCANQHTIYTAKTHVYECELSILERASNLSLCKIQRTKNPLKWLKLHEPNSWIYFIEEVETMDIICGTTTTTIQIKGTGILRLQSRCLIKHQGIIRTGFHTSVSILTNSILPAMNISEQLLEVHHSKPLLTSQDPESRRDDSQEWDDIQEEINHLKAKEILQPTQVTQHDVHQYIVSYGSIVFIIILVAIYMIRQRKKLPIPVEQPTPLS